VFYSRENSKKTEIIVVDSSENHKVKVIVESNKN
jgi:hypothetical protein